MTHISNNVVRKVAESILMVGLLLVSQMAMAQGFANEADSMVTNVRDGIYLVVGSLAAIALLWCLAQGYMGRKTWGDVLEMGLWIFGAGAAITAATWIFTSGGSISF